MTHAPATVEILAKALADEDGAAPDQWHFYKYLARAALTAFTDAGLCVVPRVATDGMVDAGWGSLSPSNCWTTMIAAVDGEKGGG
jgi:hypothetical protein